MEPRIFLANTPITAHARRMLRMRALDLHARLSRIGDGPCACVLNTPQHSPSPLDLVLLRPRSIIIGTFKEGDEPIEIGRNHPWLHEARAARAAVLDRLTTDELQAHKERSNAPTLQRFNALFGMPIAAVIVAPALHGKSRIALDVEDHRQRVKVLGLDELAPLAAMVQSGAQLDSAALYDIASQLGGTLWHDGQRLLFELGLSSYQLRVLGTSVQYPLIEGANILGRRSTPVQYEYRLAFPGDDSISADHAIVICAPDGRVVLRDTSTNGTYIRFTDGGEERIHRAEHAILPGTTLRIGETLLRLEQIQPA